ncbi:MAG: T9SS type A sorting domain-containing protein, partial [Phaeodactylibacter sp.]|nr:T9SS type A sorting domain-containing protein [Phaeodactylibacter sp.]
TNNGVIGDYDDELSSYIGTLVNNAVIAREIAGPMTVGLLHPNFLELGSQKCHTVNGVFTDEALTTFAGAYSVVSNAFNPAPAAVGLTKLYLRISDTAPICSRTVEISVPGGISLTGDPLEKELSTPTTATVDLFPNPTSGIFTIQLPEIWFDQQLDIRVIDLRGQQVRILSSIQTTQQVLEFPDTVAPGIYFVQTFLNGALKQVAQVVLER